MRIAVIHLVAKALGILIHIEGLPYGSSRNVDMTRYEKGGASCSNAAECKPQLQGLG